MSLWSRLFGRRPRPPRDAETAYRQTLRLVLDQELGDAEALLSRLVRDDSTQIDGYLALARLYRVRGEVGRAIHVHQNLLLRGDLSREQRDLALRGLAGDFRKGGFLQRAIAAYEEVLDRHPRDVAALRALGALYADVRDHEKALACHRKLGRASGEADPSGEAELLVDMAEAAHAEGRSEDARKILRRALRRDGGLARAWVRLGALEAERGKDKKALDAWRKVPEVDRRAAGNVYPQLEATYAALGKSADYEALLQKLLEAVPGDGVARLALVRALAARGDADAALEQAKALIDREPDSVHARGALAGILADHGRPEDALAALGELLALLDRQGLLVPRESLR